MSLFAVGKKTVALHQNYYVIVILALDFLDQIQEWVGLSKIPGPSWDIKYDISFLLQ